MVAVSSFYVDVLKNNLAHFIQSCFYYLNPGTQYKHNWHIDVIAEYLMCMSYGLLKKAGHYIPILEDVFNNKLTSSVGNKLVINLPPRYLKSIAVTVAWPAWLLGHCPHLRVICASYSHRIAAKLTLDCLKIMESNWYQAIFPDTKIIKTQKSRLKFVTNKGGFRYTTSMLGSVTGEGGDVIIADDPHNPTFIHSPAKRDAVINWFETTLLSRLDDKSSGLVAVVMQRLHPQDLSAHLINKNWPALVMPAQFSEEVSYKIGKYKHVAQMGDCLHSQREDEQTLAQIRQDLGLENFSAQYLQKPITSSSQVIKADWWQITPKAAWPRSFQQITVSIDTAQQVGVNNDYSVIQIWGRIGDKHYLQQQYRGKWLFPDLLELVKSSLTASPADGSNAVIPPLTTLIESQSVGQALITSLRREGYHNITPIHAKLDKLSRLQLVTGILSAQKVFIPEEALWVGDFLAEMQEFPHARHDDQLDAMVQYLYHYMQCQFKIRPTLRRVE